MIFLQIPDSIREHTNFCSWYDNTCNQLVKTYENTLPNASENIFDLLSQNRSLLAHTQLVHLDSQVLLHSFPAVQSLTCTDVRLLFLPQNSTLHLPLLNFMKLLSTQLSSLSRSCWMTAQTYDVSATLPNFLSSANLLSVLSFHPSHWWIRWKKFISWFNCQSYFCLIFCLIHTTSSKHYFFAQ